MSLTFFVVLSRQPATTLVDHGKTFLQGLVLPPDSCRDPAHQAAANLTQTQLAERLNRMPEVA